MFSFDNCDYLRGCDKICVCIVGHRQIAVGLKKLAGLVVICSRIHGLPCQNIVIEADLSLLLIEKLARISRFFSRA